MIIGSAKYNESTRVKLTWDKNARGKKRIMALLKNGGQFAITENFFHTLTEAISDIPKEFFVDWSIDVKST